VSISAVVVAVLGRPVGDVVVVVAGVPSVTVPGRALPEPIGKPSGPSAWYVSDSWAIAVRVCDKGVCSAFHAHKGFIVHPKLCLESHFRDLVDLS
jgi:hypothetical protein